MLKGKRLVWFGMAFGGAFVIACLAGRMVWQKLGSADAALAKARLQLIWPSVMDMPYADRTLLVGLSMTCRVEDRPPVAGAVADCLRSAIDDPHVLLPKGVGREQARARLESLLRQKNI